jgi:hypothetical protein
MTTRRNWTRAPQSCPFTQKQLWRYPRWGRRCAGVILKARCGSGARKCCDHRLITRRLKRGRWKTQREFQAGRYPSASESNGGKPVRRTSATDQPRSRCKRREVVSETNERGGHSAVFLIRSCCRLRTIHSATSRLGTQHSQETVIYVGGKGQCRTASMSGM